MLIEPPALKPRRFSVLSLGLAVMNGLGMLGALLSVGLMAVLGGLSSLGMSAGMDAFLLSAMGWFSAASALLLLPGLVYAVRRLGGSDRPAWSLKNVGLYSRIGVFLWPALLLLAYYASTHNLETGILAPLQVLVVGIPLWFILEVSRRNLPGGKPHQEWGVFSAGVVVVMPLVFIVETILVIAAVIISANAILGQQTLAEELNRLVMRINSSNFDPEVISRAILPMLQRPAVLATILLVASGLVPLVEEFFKPLPLWVLSGKRLTPAQGFNLGMVSGVAFALVESVGYLSGAAGTDWVWTAAGRVGSGLLHVTSSGLVGWGMAEGWHNRRYRRLALGYAAAVALHGLWNFFGLLTGLVPFIDVTAGLVGFLRGMGQIAPYALGALGLGLLTILLYMNQYLRRQSALDAAASSVSLLATMQPVFEPMLDEQPALPVEAADQTTSEDNLNGNH